MESCSPELEGWTGAGKGPGCRKIRKSIRSYSLRLNSREDRENTCIVFRLAVLTQRKEGKDRGILTGKKMRRIRPWSLVHPAAGERL